MRILIGVFIALATVLALVSFNKNNTKQVVNKTLEIVEAPVTSVKSKQLRDSIEEREGTSPKEQKEEVPSKEVLSELEMHELNFRIAEIDEEIEDAKLIEQANDETISKEDRQLLVSFLKQRGRLFEEKVKRLLKKSN